VLVEFSNLHFASYGRPPARNDGRVADGVDQVLRRLRCTPRVPPEPLDSRGSPLLGQPVPEQFGLQSLQRLRACVRRFHCEHVNHTVDVAAACT
jgi:hypothetical protein